MQNVFAQGITTRFANKGRTGGVVILARNFGFRANGSSEVPMSTVLLRPPTHNFDKSVKPLRWYDRMPVPMSKLHRLKRKAT